MVFLLLALARSQEHCSPESRLSFNEASWEPERHLHDLAQGEDSWSGVLRAVFRSSLEELTPKYEAQDAKNMIEVMMRPEFDVTRVLVIDNRVVVGRPMLFKNKSIPLAVTVAQAAGRRKLASAMWIHSSSSKGNLFFADVDGRKVPMPTSMIAKRHDEPGLLVPNPYFYGGDVLGGWEMEREVFRKSRDKHEWHKRDARVFWRGAVRSARGCDRGFGNYARLQAISLSFCRPDDFDVLCEKTGDEDAEKSGCHPGQNFSFDCPEKFPDDPDIPLAVESGGVSTDVHVAPQRFAHNQFLLNLPGSTQGSYSRNLNHLWAMGAVVLLWDSPYVEWYYAALTHGLTHLSVNKSTIVGILEHVRQKPELIRTLIEGATAVDRHLVCGFCQVKFLSDAIAMMHNHFNWGSVLNSDFAYVNPPDVPCTPTEPRFYELFLENGTSRVAYRPIPCNFSAAMLHNTPRGHILAPSTKARREKRQRRRR